MGLMPGFEVGSFLEIVKRLDTEDKKRKSNVLS